MRAAGSPVPRVRDLRISRLAGQSGLRAASHQFVGAYRRARRGAFSEPVPGTDSEPLPLIQLDIDRPAATPPQGSADDPSG
jgi:hypothetical protein